MMKKILSLLVIISSFSLAQGQKVVHSGKENIKTLVNGVPLNWGISPETNPDRLRVYCAREKNEVIFQTDVDTAFFSVRNNDTIKFIIILNGRDTARTEIIGIRDLPDKISKIEKVYWLSQLWAETKYNFVNVDRLTFDLDSLYKAYIPLVTASPNDFEYYRVLQKFMANLHDGHSEVSSNGQFSPFTDYITVGFEDFNQKVYVSVVRKIPGQDSTWVGAELIEIENIPTAQYFKTFVFPYLSASTGQHLWMQGIYRIQNGLKDHPFRGTIKKRDGTIQKIELQRNGEAIRTPQDQYWGPVHHSSPELVDLKWLDNDLALVSFNRFMPEEPAMKNFDKVAKQLSKAKGVIIDLRNNGGGSTEVAWHLQKYLTKGDYFLNYAWETRINDGVGKANGNWIDTYKDFYLNKAYRFEKPDTIRVSDTIKRITCPVIILIGRYTFSAAEDFLVNIYELPGRPELIGESTGGSTGSPLVVSDLPGGGYARICTRRICFPVSSKRFVNSGIKPDIEVKPSIEDFLQGRDAVLERAIKELKNTGLSPK